MTILIAALVARLVLASNFAFAGIAKLADPDDTKEMLVGFGVRGRVTSVIAALLRLVELVIAAALLAPPVAFPAAVAAFLLLASFTGLIAANLISGRRPACDCFGQLGSAPIGPRPLALREAIHQVGAN